MRLRTVCFGVSTKVADYFRKRHHELQSGDHAVMLKKVTQSVPAVTQRDSRMECLTNWGRGLVRATVHTAETGCATFLFP